MAVPNVSKGLEEVKMAVELAYTVTSVLELTE
jgi:hypothetical protein